MDCLHAYVYYMGYWLIQCKYGFILLEACIYTLYGMLAYTVHATCEKTFGISKYFDALSKLTIVPSSSSNY